MDPSVVMKNQPDAKRMKIDQGQPSVDKAKQGIGKMIELDIFGSDEEMWLLYVASCLCTVFCTLKGQALGEREDEVWTWVVLVSVERTLLCH